jgi:hypothetical protein
VLSYRVILDVPLPLVLFVSRLLAAHRREIGTRDGTRALTCWKQAVFTLAWFRDRPGRPRPGEKPARGELDIDTKTRNALLRSLRYQGERGFALMPPRWRALQRVMVSPTTIGDIARSAPHRIRGVTKPPAANRSGITARLH